MIGHATLTDEADLYIIKQLRLHTEEFNMKLNFKTAPIYRCRLVSSEKCQGLSTVCLDDMAL